MTHFDGAGLDHEAVQNNEMGLIVLAESLDDLPEYCGTILQITPDGRCQVSNHLGEQIIGTPIGVTAGFAAATAAAITDAVGDEPQALLPPAARHLPQADLPQVGVPQPDAPLPPAPAHRSPGVAAHGAPEEELEHGPFLADDFADELSSLFGPELPSSE
jgi:hypothetical protein